MTPKHQHSVTVPEVKPDNSRVSSEAVVLSSSTRSVPQRASRPGLGTENT